MVAAACQTRDLHDGTGLDPAGLHTGRVTCETVVSVGPSYPTCGDHDNDRT